MSEIEFLRKEVSELRKEVADLRIAVQHAPQFIPAPIGPGLWPKPSSPWDSPYVVTCGDSTVHM